MTVHRRSIFIHGLEGSSQGFKATHLRQHYPDLLVPDFRGPIDERMKQLTHYLTADDHQEGSGGHPQPWIIIGSSYGGLMAILFAAQHPDHVAKLILFAPALTRPFYAGEFPPPVTTPTVIYHGQNDTVVPLEPTRKFAERVCTNLTFHEVDDDHSLHTTFLQLDLPHFLD